MTKWNAYTLCNLLKAEKGITMPQLQQLLSADYSQTGEILQEMIRRGWLEDKPLGMFYAARPENLRLRHLRRAEMDKLLEDVKRDWARGVALLSREPGTDRAALGKKFRCEEEEEDDMIRQLLQADLIYVWQDRYYSCVSKLTARFLDEVVFHKERLKAKHGEKYCIQRDASILSLVEDHFAQEAPDP